MKKYLLFILLLFILKPASAARHSYDSIDIGGITGTDTIIVIPLINASFSRPFAIEIDYSDLDADDATFDVGYSIISESRTLDDSSNYTGTFNSYGTLIGGTLPLTLDATTQLATTIGTYTGKATKVYQNADKFMGRVLLLYFSKGSVTSGHYVKYAIQSL